MKNKTEMKKFEKLQVELNNTETVKYQEVVSLQNGIISSNLPTGKKKTFQSKNTKHF